MKYLAQFLPAHPQWLAMIAGLTLLVWTSVAAAGPRTVIRTAYRWSNFGVWSITCADGTRVNGAPSPAITLTGYTCQTTVFTESGTAKATCTHT